MNLRLKTNTKYATLYRQAIDQYNFLLSIRKMLPKDQTHKKSEYYKMFSETEALINEIVTLEKELLS